jgi:hypothetical protein
VGVLGQGLLE